MLPRLVLSCWLLTLPGLLHPAEKPDPHQIEGGHTLERIECMARWEPLFDGKSLQGWTGDTENYRVENGVLVCTKGAKDLRTEAVYSDFVFRFAFRLEESGNNGIGLRVPEGGRAAYEGMEIQILDHDGSRYVTETAHGRKLTWLESWQKHGSIYGVFPARTGYLKPPGEWNEQVIICIEDHVKVVLNGAVILDVYLDELTPLDGKAHPGMKNRSGHITLAGHNDRVEFRDLAVADFSPAPLVPESAQDNTAPDGFVALFNGVDLSGWKGLAHKNAEVRRGLEGEALEKAQAEADRVMREHWSVADGVLTYDGRGQSLCTERDYGDFEMYVDWKIPPGADSGIYLRGTPQIQIWDPWFAENEEGGYPDSPDEWVASYRTGRNLGSGGLWNNRRHSNRPLVRADRKPGEWNTFLIRMVGERVSIWLNGEQVVDRTVLENFWDKERIAPLPRVDQIELQHHGSELSFKNLYLRELPH